MKFSVGRQFIQLAVRPPDKSRGLGDTVAKITKATRLDRVAEFVSKVFRIPCGCKKRQEVLNQMFPYK
jgi:hypothetical protein